MLVPSGSVCGFYTTSGARYWRSLSFTTRTTTSPTRTSRSFSIELFCEEMEAGMLRSAAQEIHPCFFSRLPPSDYDLIHALLGTDTLTCSVMNGCTYLPSSNTLLLQLFVLSSAGGLWTTCTLDIILQILAICTSLLFPCQYEKVHLAQCETRKVMPRPRGTNVKLLKSLQQTQVNTEHCVLLPLEINIVLSLLSTHVHTLLLHNSLCHW